MNVEIAIGKWNVNQSEDGKYLYITRADKPGQIHVKADDEGYIVDVWPDHGLEPTDTIGIPYQDLEAL